MDRSLARANSPKKTNSCDGNRFPQFGQMSNEAPSSLAFAMRRSGPYNRRPRSRSGPALLWLSKPKPQCGHLACDMAEHLSVVRPHSLLGRVLWLEHAEYGKFGWVMDPMKIDLLGATGVPSA